MPFKDPIDRREYLKRHYDEKPHLYAEGQRRYHKAHKQIIAARRRAKRYGMTYEQYCALEESQNDKCALCGLDGTENKHGHLCVDHDHATGRVRGLLCFKCNFALGFLEQHSFVEKARRYLGL